MTTNDLVTDILLEINAIDAGDAPSPGLAMFVLGKVNSLFDLWNASRRKVFCERFFPFTLTPGLANHTIGVAANSPTFTVTVNRPQTIDGANLILDTSTPDIYTPIEVVRYPWWLAQTVPALETSIPGWLYYEPTWPNGSCRFWPVPDTAYGVQLMIREVLAQLALGDTFTMPPGYRSAVTLTVAEDCSGPLRKQWTPLQEKKARDARAEVFDNNTFAPALKTRDAGMPGSGDRSGIYNWRTGQPFPN